jgi:hypothetical protein
MVVICCYPCCPTENPPYQRDDSTSVVAIASCDSRLSGAFRSKCVGLGVGSDGVRVLVWVMARVYSKAAMLVYLWQTQNKIERQKRLHQFTRRPL